MNQPPLFPAVHVQVGRESGTFLVAHCIKSALRQSVPSEIIEDFAYEALSQDNTHLLKTCLKYWDCIL